MLQGGLCLTNFAIKCILKWQVWQWLLYFDVAYDETNPEVPQDDEKTSIEDREVSVQAGLKQKKNIQLHREFSGILTPGSHKSLFLLYFLTSPVIFVETHRPQCIGIQPRVVMAAFACYTARFSRFFAAKA